MKLVSNFIFILTMGLSLNAWSTSASGQMKGFEIKSCSVSGKQKCIRLRSEEASMSQFLPIYSFKIFNIEITENNKTRKISGQSGFLDLASRQIVVRKDNSQSDYAINMDTLNELDYSK